ncbi:mucin-5AC-like isoform X2 [Pecten maximus]|uniref:mucin-5AC-like isoform X2 n=1 Tax=Pecten maximus TaxID=6579 RepID=UPI001458100B|nr:mucin-5AC-like isoform X2 [Pecten maximus]
MILLCLLLFICYVTSSSTDPCQTYDDFLADYKRSPSHTESEYDNAECDATLTEKWYRIDGAAGTDLTNDSGLLQNYVCGTVYQMWMNGNIPEESEGIVDRQICLRTVFSTCQYSFTIQVKNCCSFRVYYLKSAGGCPRAYCVSDTNVTSSDECPNVTTSTETMATDTTSAATTKTITDTTLAATTKTITDTTSATTTKTITDTTSVSATSTDGPITQAETSTTSSTDPCQTYEDFLADYKRSPSHTESEYDNAECDATLTEKWYRIDGAAGTDLTNDSGLLQNYVCGTVYQMWMNGNIPEESEGIVDRQICLRTVFSTCQYSFTIQVKNCCSFRVYYLKSAGGCPHAYCVSDTNVTSSDECPNVTTSTETMATDTTSAATTKTITDTTLAATTKTITDTTSATTTKTITDTTSVSATSTDGPITQAETSTTSSTDPCQTYEDFLADYKRSPSHTESEYDNAECDATLTEKWYRIDGAAGTDLTNDSGLLQNYVCGTVYQMWMNGNIPEESEGIVDRQICLRTVFSTCQYSFTIQVKNCCSFRVYYLKSAGGCPHAYCVSDTNVTTSDECPNVTSDTTSTETMATDTTSAATTKTITDTTLAATTKTITYTTSATTTKTITDTTSASATSTDGPITQAETSTTSSTDPCQTYENFLADYKRSPSHTESEYDNAECDATLTEKWYRIDGDAGTDLTNDSGLLQNYVCGTVYQMWMNGNIPEESEGIVDRQICLRTVFSTCHYSFTIQVKNCCSFRVYYLKSAGGCPHAYCVSDVNLTSLGVCPNTDTTAETTSVRATSTDGPITLTGGSTTTRSNENGAEYTVIKKDKTILIVVLVTLVVVLMAVFIGVCKHASKKFKNKRSVSTISLMSWFSEPTIETPTPPANTTEDHALQMYRITEKGGVSENAIGQNVPGEAVEEDFAS